MDSVSQFPLGLWQSENINFVLDVGAEMKIKGCEVGWPWWTPDRSTSPNPLWTTWHQGKLWNRSYNVAERRPVRTGYLLPRCLAAVGCKEQFQHVQIRHSTHCFLSEEKWSINRAPMNKTWILSHCCGAVFQYVTCIKSYKLFKVHFNL
jgi:hypothetical protein